MANCVLFQRLQTVEAAEEAEGGKVSTSCSPRCSETRFGPG